MNLQPDPPVLRLEQLTKRQFDALDRSQCVVILTASPPECMVRTCRWEPTFWRAQGACATGRKLRAWRRNPLRSNEKRIVRSRTASRIVPIFVDSLSTAHHVC